eukprot:CAMPEP_0119148738 /NCGR_PEP_ID=MMETSP1310-20130426/42273_1 /TAXON_ID=464262 /ORGANISM="Genus nov. species nov., Strain RCC2339" /LENGTH=1628 /DNA_ID=CAMNT_0007140789 /DNA_START=186 /DNA_END=5072 /DNA_ORIENTATION=-
MSGRSAAGVEKASLSARFSGVVEDTESPFVLSVRVSHGYEIPTGSVAVGNNQNLHARVISHDDHNELQVKGIVLDDMDRIRRRSSRSSTRTEFDVEVKFEVQSSRDVDLGTLCVQAALTGSDVLVHTGIWPEYNVEECIKTDVNLAVRKTFDLGELFEPLAPLDTFSYVVTVDNQGVAAVEGSALYDLLPQGVLPQVSEDESYAPVTFNGVEVAISPVGTCALNADNEGSLSCCEYNLLDGGQYELGCDLPSLPCDDDLEVRIPVRIQFPFPTCDKAVFNQAVAGASGPLGLHLFPSDDPNSDEVLDPTRLFIEHEPRLTVEKSSNVTAAAEGATLFYTVSVLNGGNGPACDLEIIDGLQSVGAEIDSESASVSVEDATVIETITDDGLVLHVDVSFLAGCGSEPVELTYSSTVRPPYACNTCNKPGISNTAQVRYGDEVVFSDDPRTSWTDATIVDLLSDTFEPEPEVVAYKNFDLAYDANHNGLADPGDVVAYTVDVQNVGNMEACNAVLYDPLDTATTTLKVGSVRSTAGVVVRGNSNLHDDPAKYWKSGRADEDVLVEAGHLPSNGSFSVYYEVTVNEALPVSREVIRNQGQVSAANIEPVPTTFAASASDVAPSLRPDAVPLHTPTLSALGGEAQKLTLTLDWLIEDDHDRDGNVNPGDSVRIWLTLRNDGNAAFTSVTLRDPLQRVAEASLVTGSVRTSAGTIVRGNKYRDNRVQVDLGSLGYQSEVVVQYVAQIADTFPASRDELSFQAHVIGNVFLAGNEDGQTVSVISGNKRTTIVDDPTVISIDTAPAVTTAERITYGGGFLDLDGTVVPGQILRYSYTVENLGDQATGPLRVVVELDNDLSVVTDGYALTSSAGVIGTDGPTTVVLTVAELAAAGGKVSLFFEAAVASPYEGDYAVQNTISVTAENVEYTHPSLVAVIVEASLPTLVSELSWTGADVSHPGDTITFAGVIRNTGAVSAADVFVSFALDTNLVLERGTVAVSEGGVVRDGNSAASTFPSASFGTVAAGAEVSVTFTANVAPTLLASTESVVVQGEVSGSNFAPFLTTDPSQLVLDRPTFVPVTSSPLISLTKSWEGERDSVLDGKIDPGDELTYTITIRNYGTGEATDVLLVDPFDKASALIAGAVTLSGAQGSILAGNTVPEDDAEEDPNESVIVSIPSLPGLSAATVTFPVVVSNPFTGARQQLENLAEVVGSNFDSVLSRDPNTNFIDSPTITPVVSAPFFRERTSYTLEDSTTGVLRLTTEFQNVGNQDAKDFSLTYNFGVAWSLASEDVEVSPSDCCSEPVISDPVSGAVINEIVEIDIPELAVGESVKVSMLVVLSVEDGAICLDPSKGQSSLDNCFLVQLVFAGDQFESQVFSSVEVDPAATPRTRSLGQGIREIRLPESVSPGLSRGATFQLPGSAASRMFVYPADESDALVSAGVPAELRERALVPGAYVVRVEFPVRSADPMRNIQLVVSMANSAASLVPGAVAVAGQKYMVEESTGKLLHLYFEETTASEEPVRVDMVVTLPAEAQTREARKLSAAIRDSVTPSSTEIVPRLSLREHLKGSTTVIYDDFVTLHPRNIVERQKVEMTSDVAREASPTHGDGTLFWSLPGMAAFVFTIVVVAVAGRKFL